MSKLDDLINELCPDGVEWKKIESICIKISSGGTPNTTKKDYYNGNIPWLRTQEINFSDIFDTEIKISDDGLNNSSAKWIPVNCVIVAMYGATVGKIGINKIPLTTNQACCNLEIDAKICDYKYVFYCLSNQYEFIKSLGQGAQTNINAQIVKNLEIPIPPLEIQNEIVRILDNFTELETKLAEELVCRKKQYEYYRDKLLTFGDEVEWKTLGEIAKYSDTKIKNTELKPFSYVSVENLLQQKKGVVFNEKVPEGNNWIQYIQNDILIGNIRPYLRKIWKADRVGGTNGDVLTIRIIDDYKDTLNSDYLFYLLSSEDFFNYDIQYSKGAKMPRGSKDEVMKYKIPIPPLAEQERIVKILDKFDSLCNDLTVGLPAEIEARHKQYEYYRDKLLTFKRKA